MLAALVALPVLGGGWLWLRQSSFVAVQRVQIAGVHGPDAAAIDAALVTAARHMSTLHVQPGVLRTAVAAFPVVREVRAKPRFPHGLEVEVLEQLPVAALIADGARTAVAADGVALGPALLSSSLPSVSGYFEPAAGQRVSGPNVLAALTVLGAAPAPLARLVLRVYTGPQGLTVAMRNGLLAYFGNATRPHAKWLSLARVLADSSSAGASYVDVRLPERPAAGFPAGVQAPDSTSGSPESTGATESTVASLAAALTAGAPAATPVTEPTSAPASEPSSEASGDTGEQEAATETEAPSGQAEAAEPGTTTGG